MKKAVILFAKAPVPGLVKTRLMPYYDENECALLGEAMLLDELKALRSKAWDLLVFFASFKEKEEEGLRVLKEITGPADYFPQEGADLGERMNNAFNKVFSLGYEEVLLVGSDIPELTEDIILDSFRALKDDDYVLNATEDGGYYLIGMRSHSSLPFVDQTYSHDQVFNNTRETILNAGSSLYQGKTLHDIDNRDDIRLFRDRIRDDRSLQRLRTASFVMEHVDISVIVPIYNEETTILALLDMLRPYNDKCQIILVDGGSQDKTLSMIPEDFKVLRSDKGRARQMNAGAKESRGDILFFLHADSEIPANFLSEIKDVMAKRKAGCFGIAFHSKQFFMWTCRVISNHRVFDRKVMFGDQGIFIDRNLFFSLSGFPDLPIMEDYEFSLMLKRKKVKLGMTKHRIYTSDRRFPRANIPKLKVMWKMNRLRKMYRDGMDINIISDMYKDVR